MNSKVTFLDYECEVDIGEYQSGGPALQLIGAAGTDYEGEPVAVASVYVGPLAPDEVAIKNYSENEGVLDVLVAAGVVSEPMRYVSSGYAMVPVCKLLAQREAA